MTGMSGIHDLKKLFLQLQDLVFIEQFNIGQITEFFKKLKLFIREPVCIPFCPGGGPPEESGNELMPQRKIRICHT
jgi:hypothetical protein